MIAGVPMQLSDGEFMGRAIRVAQVGKTRSAPNPWVGCVVVSEGAIIGEGATHAPGGPHAEIGALAAAGDRARGATAYVTLEPCSHFGRTPPCVDALIAAGVKRVVTGIEDPDPLVAGEGHARLRAAGLDVTEGVGAAAVRSDLAPYVHQRKTGRAFCLCKTAASLDGRTAAADGSSQWITGTEARADAHRLRAESQAVVVGSYTAITDRPSLTARDIDPLPLTQPVRVLIDAKGRVSAEGPLFDTALARTLVITTDASTSRRREEWGETGAAVEVVDTGPLGRGVDLRAMLQILVERFGVIQAMIEGGARLHGALIAEGLVDRMVSYVAPVIIGDGGMPMLGFAGAETIAGALRWSLVDVARFGEDVRLTFEPPTVAVD